MSDTDLPLDMRQILAQIDRTQAETRKLLAEQVKLTAEAAKFNRERFLAPAVALAATLGAIATVTVAILKWAAEHGWPG